MTKITSNFPPPVPLTVPARRSTTTSVDSVNANAAVGAASTVLTSSRLTPSSPASASHAPVDTAKVAQIRAAVLDGTYKPDAAKIADTLVGLEKQLP